jgi:hypothetical protein
VSASDASWFRKAPSADESFLSHILGLEPIIEQEERQTPDRVLITPDQFAICAPISSPCQVDEFGIALRVHLLLRDSSTLAVKTLQEIGL